MEQIQQFIGNDQAATAAVQALTQAGGRVFVVGGAVRDAVLNKPVKDVDLMCAGLTDDQIEAALAPVGKLNFTGKDFGVYRLRVGDDEVEIALPRTERSTGSGHKDFDVTADPFLDPSVDLSRRDFTGNAMAFDPNTNELLDPHGGQADLENGDLKLVNPQAFKDDPLRIVRALVANARFGLQPDQELIDSMQRNAQAIRHLPGERIQMELDKLLSAADPASAIHIAAQTGVLDYMAPELSATIGFDQMNPHHDLDVFSHTMEVLRAMTKLSNDPDMRLAALFHDSGKPESFWRDETAPEGGGGHFYKKKLDKKKPEDKLLIDKMNLKDGDFLGEDHEDVGARLVDSFMQRLRYPNARRERVVFLVQNHMWKYFSSEKGARKFLAACNNDIKVAFDLLTIRKADSAGKIDGQMSDFDAEEIQKAETLLRTVIDNQDATSVRDLALNGRDLMELGLRGPEIGQTQRRLLNAVIDNPELNTKDALSGLVRAWTTTA
jgi:tRNA nucleotidyltransferase (CCA-adding enzyme)